MGIEPAKFQHGGPPKKPIKFPLWRRRPRWTLVDGQTRTVVSRPGQRFESLLLGLDGAAMDLNGGEGRSAGLFVYCVWGFPLSWRPELRHSPS